MNDLKNCNKVEWIKKELNERHKKLVSFYGEGLNRGGLENPNPQSLYKSADLESYCKMQLEHLRNGRDRYVRNPEQFPSSLSTLETLLCGDRNVEAARKLDDADRSKQGLETALAHFFVKTLVHMEYIYLRATDKVVPKFQEFTKTMSFIRTLDDHHKKMYYEELQGLYTESQDLDEFFYYSKVENAHNSEASQVPETPDLEETRVKLENQHLTSLGFDVHSLLEQLTLNVAESHKCSNDYNEPENIEKGLHALQMKLEEKFAVGILQAEFPKNYNLYNLAENCSRALDALLNDGPLKRAAGMEHERELILECHKAFSKEDPGIVIPELSRLWRIISHGEGVNFTEIEKNLWNCLGDWLVRIMIHSDLLFLKATNKTDDCEYENFKENIMSAIETEKSIEEVYLIELYTFTELAKSNGYVGLSTGYPATKHAEHIKAITKRMQKLIGRLDLGREVEISINNRSFVESELDWYSWELVDIEPDYKWICESENSDFAEPLPHFTREDSIENPTAWTLADICLKGLDNLIRESSRVREEKRPYHDRAHIREYIQVSKKLIGQGMVSFLLDLQAEELSGSLSDMNHHHKKMRKDICHILINVMIRINFLFLKAPNAFDTKFYHLDNYYRGWKSKFDEVSNSVLLRNVYLQQLFILSSNSPDGNLLTIARYKNLESKEEFLSIKEALVKMKNIGTEWKQYQKK